MDSCDELDCKAKTNSWKLDNALSSVRSLYRSKSDETQELVLRALDGCALSSNEIAERYIPRLVRFLEKRMGGRFADAEDIAQETLAHAIANLHKFDRKHQFSTWLFTIGYRKSVDFLRRENRKPRVSEIPLEDIACNNEDSVTSRSEAEAIWVQARRLLVEQQYDALWLRYGEDLSIPEIAVVMGKSQLGIRVLLHRARNRMNSVLTPRHNRHELSGRH